MVVENTPGWRIGSFINKYGDEPWFVILAFFTMIPIAMISGIINIFYKHIWFCNVWGWHMAPKEQGFDGASLNGKCPICGKRVMQDSQGNWF